MSWRSCPRDVHASARARTSIANSIAAAPPRPTSSSAVSASPIRSRRRAHDQVVDRAGVHADPGLRAGRRPRRAVRAPAAPARHGWRSDAMQLTVWTYEGPPHVGAMRIATAMQGVHYVLHAPQGDTYADLLFTMIERRDKRPPVTYTTFQARDLGRRHGRAVQDGGAGSLRALPAGRAAGRRLVHGGADPGRSRRSRQGARPARAGRCRWSCRPTSGRKTGAPPKHSIGWSGRLPAQRTDTWLVRAARTPGTRARCNLLGPTALGFRHRDDVPEVTEAPRRASASTLTS